LLPNSISIRDIAHIAGVSIGTVDRVIHNRGQVAQDTRIRVLKAIEELQYVPNVLARTLASKKISNIAILLPSSENNPYWKQPLEGIQQAAREILPFNFNVQLFLFDYSNEESFRSQCSAALLQKPAGIILAPLFNSSALSFVQECDKAKIPFVFLDEIINNCTPLAYFGQNSVQSGRVAGRLLLTSLKTIENIAVFELHTANAPSYHIELREKGFFDYFENNIEVNNSQKSKLIFPINLENANDEFERILKQHPDIQGIFVPNSRSYILAHWLSENYNRKIIIIGYDLLDENFFWLNNGVIDFLLCQRPQEQGYKSIMALFNFLFYNRNTEKFNYCPIDVILKENSEYYHNFQKNFV
jgi:LacI family transcriptional regulator